VDPKPLPQGYKTFHGIKIMKSIPVIAIFDIGKTNKKAFLFNEAYKIVWQESTELDEILDEDGETCENIESLVQWVKSVWKKMNNLSDFSIKALNFSTYGASLVNVNEKGESITPLYSYLKIYPKELQASFYAKYGGEELFTKKTASPVLSSLNSGMQLLRLKEYQPEVFKRLKYYLHLPQFISSLFTGKFHAEYTSIGCHTNFWDFEKNMYHEWVEKEGFTDKTPALKSAKEVFKGSHGIKIGTGLHDSSAALIPYIRTFKEPFVLISTGTWSISMNPFNDKVLTSEELEQDVLCFLTFEGKLVKASRLFIGKEHEEHVNYLAEKYKVSKKEVLESEYISTSTKVGYQDNYNLFIQDLAKRQSVALNLIVHNSPVKKVFVDGGFSKNIIFMKRMALLHPEIEFYAAEVAQASSIGAALVIHEHWNTKEIPEDLISLKKVLA
jgi:L-fuculokinase